MAVMTGEVMAVITGNCITLSGIRYKYNGWLLNWYDCHFPRACHLEHVGRQVPVLLLCMHIFQGSSLEICQD